MFAARAAYATWLTSFHELKVSASCCGLRYRADYYSRARSRVEGMDLHEKKDTREKEGEGPERDQGEE